MTEEEGMSMMLNVLIQIVIAALIFISIFIYIQNIYTNDSFEKRYLAKDLALAIEAIQTPQGNTVINYAKDTDSYSIVFKDNRVEVFSRQDQPEPPSFLRGISGFFTDNSFRFENTDLSYAGAGIQPILIKTDNELIAAIPGMQYSTELYNIRAVDTSKEQKNYTFSADPEELEDYVKTTVSELNSQLEVSFTYYEENPDFIISESQEENIIYVPASKTKRKLASIIANKFIEQGKIVLILPSGNNRFTIKIEKGLTAQLSAVLRDSFKEYYNG